MVRKRYEDEDFIVDPFFEEEESEDIQGPTDALPYRFTEQALNPRAEATTGVAQRTPTARSAFGGGVANPGGIRSDIMYKDTLPMRTTTIAGGKLSEYDKLAGYSDINDPGSLRGREQIAGLKGFEGDTQRTSVMDMKAIGESMGFSPEKVDQLMNVQREDTYTQQERYKSGETRGGNIQYSNRDVGDAMSINQRDELMSQGKLSENDFTTGSRITSDTNLVYGKDGQLGNEERFFRGLMNMSDRTGDFDKNTMGGDQKPLEFNLGSARQLNEVVGMGSMDPSEYDMKDDLFTQQRDVNRRLQHGGKENKWSSRFQTFGKLAIMAGFGVAGGALIGPAAAGAMGVTGAAGTGAVAGGIGGFTAAGTGQMMNDEFSAKQLGMATGMGALAGGALNYYGSANAATPNASSLQTGDTMTASAQFNPDQSNVFAPSASSLKTGQPMTVPTDFNTTIDPMTGLPATGAPEAAGTTDVDTKEVFKQGSDISLQTEKSEMAKEQAMDRQRQQTQSSAQANANTIQKTRSQLEEGQGGLFGTQLPDDPYYDPEEDFGGIQQGVF